MVTIRHMFYIYLIENIEGYEGASSLHRLNLMQAYANSFDWSECIHSSLGGRALSAIRMPNAQIF